MTNLQTPNQVLPTYSVNDLNESIGLLLSRGFAPKFILKATVLKAQIKKGHLWLTFSDGKSSIDGVAWSSTLKSLKFLPKEDDGVVILGKLNFWEAQARISVQVFDIRASISTVLKKFEIVKSKLFQEGLIDDSLRKKLPKYPSSIGILTSVPSSALADMLRTAKERWPLTKLHIIPIPVQGNNENEVKFILKKLKLNKLELKAIVLARGGGSREDLMLFDSETIAREIATYPIPVITGIGHEDDLTVCDLVADYRSSTPTAAIVDLLPSRDVEKINFLQNKKMLKDYFKLFFQNKKSFLITKKSFLQLYSPRQLIKSKRIKIKHIYQLLDVLSPKRLLNRGFALITDGEGNSIYSVKCVKKKDKFLVQLSDGKISAEVDNINYDKV
ncbi:exodeoxyribonuclease VII large subunit [Prochlorococcus marinus]|uniref:Exodeoxyribonuclease 7 large subunit n=1 Tax=Prochlorococcus marinus XMU1408 TaxID=2213228 RepID=A0A318RIX7_PROMR|nr:exodeoxyribonuclease VII large subunit [Prochlorococcus marinus]MBW3041154.1 exodeoxyribonuclease VII large subunit [Prochlorococcus marinus str. XMU1408]PYE03752.1 exodeoxyribonuclease VII large subunit [Prochlorococcus marinus XMU1408]